MQTHIFSDSQECSTWKSAPSGPSVLLFSWKSKGVLCKEKKEPFRENTEAANPRSHKITKPRILWGTGEAPHILTRKGKAVCN